MITRPGFLRLWLACCVFCSCGLTTPGSNAASFHAWDGSSSGYWSQSANWFGGAPVNGDWVVFNSGPSRLITTNDLSVILERAIFNAPGYVIRGTVNSLIITNNLLVAHGAGTTTLDIYTRLWQGLTITNVNAGALLLFNGIVDTDRDPLIFRGDGDFNIPAQIRNLSGSGLALVKEGRGTLSLGSSNELNQRLIEVHEGTLRLTHQFALGSNGTVNVAESGTLHLSFGNNFPKHILLAGTLTNIGEVTLTGGLTLGGSNAVIQNSSGWTLTVPVTVSGTGGFEKEGPGILRMTGTNTYTGATVIRDGRLIVGGSQPASPIFIHQGLLYGTGTVGAVSCVGTGYVQVAGGEIIPGPSSLTCGGITMNPSTSLYSDLVNTGPGGFRQLIVNGTADLGDAYLTLNVWNSFRVGDSFVLLDNDGADPISGQFRGLPEGSSMIVTNFGGGYPPTRLQITYFGGDGNDVAVRVLPLGSIWDGSADGNWTNAANWASNFRPFVGDTLFFPAGAARTSNFCNYAVGTPFTSIHFGGSGYHLAGNAITLAQGISAATNTGLNRISLPLTLTANQTFTASNDAVLRLDQINTQGSELALDGDGDFELGFFVGNGPFTKRGTGSATFLGSDSYSGAITVQGGELRLTPSGILGIFAVGTTVFAGATLSLDGGQTIFEPLTLAGTLKRNNSGSGTPRAWNGAISLQGAASVEPDTLPMTIGGVISGPGSLIKNGSGLLTLTRSNTYSGATVVNAGSLFINGVQAQNLVQLNGGALGGTGVLGQVIASGAGTKRVEPGNSIGILTTSNIVFNSLTIFTVDLNGATPGTGHDQLNVRGTINLGNSRLDPIPGPSMAAGQVLRIINNDGTDAISGRFANLPEGGSMLASNGMQLRITYQGGDGNDVVVTVENPPSRISTVSRTPEGYTSLTGQGLPNVLYTLEASTTLLPGSWEVVAVDLADPSGVYEFIDVDAPTYAHRFYRVSSP